MSTTAPSANDLQTLIDQATSSVFDRPARLNSWNGVDFDVNWGDASLVRLEMQDTECDAISIHVFNKVGVLLLTANVPTCAVLAATDAMVRSRQS